MCVAGTGVRVWLRSRFIDERSVDVAVESYPDDLRYHREHDWARVEGDTATLGITWYGQEALGELVHFEPPDVGAMLVKDGAYGEVESVKAVSDLVAPLSGEVLEVNQRVVEEPELVNEDSYGEGWLVRIRVADPGEADGLMDAEAYRALLVSL
jgi:glycine cleavage system H protein